MCRSLRHGVAFHSLAVLESSWSDCRVYGDVLPRLSSHTDGWEQRWQRKLCAKQSGPSSSMLQVLKVTHGLARDASSESQEKRFPTIMVASQRPAAHRDQHYATQQQHRQQQPAVTTTQRCYHSSSNSCSSSSSCNSNLLRADTMAPQSSDPADLPLPASTRWPSRTGLGLEQVRERERESERERASESLVVYPSLRLSRFRLGVLCSCCVVACMKTCVCVCVTVCVFPWSASPFCWRWCWG